MDLKLVQSMDVEPGYTVGEVNRIFKQNEEVDNFPVIKFFLMKFVTFYLKRKVHEFNDQPFQTINTHT